jgi:hypothetical protein
MKTFQEFLLEDIIKYKLPNADLEYGEAQRYPELQNKEIWQDAVSTGTVTYLYKLKNVGNIDSKLSNLNKNKMKRVKEQISKGVIEYPIVGNFDGGLDLISGNTRIAVLRSMGIEPKVLLINIQKDDK